MSEFDGLGGQSSGVPQGRIQQEECKESLLSVIEEQIIPRLLNVQQYYGGVSPERWADADASGELRSGGHTSELQ